MQTHRLKLSTLAMLVVIVAAAGVVCWLAATEVLAQRATDRDQRDSDRDQRDPFDRPPPPPRDRDPDFGPPRPGGFGAMPRGPQPGGVAMVAYLRYVYVLRGNTLYQFDATELRLLRKVPLEGDRIIPRSVGPRDAPRRGPTDRDRPPRTDRPGGDRPARDFRPDGDRPPRTDRPTDDRPPQTDRPDGDRQ